LLVHQIWAGFWGETFLECRPVFFSGKESRFCQTFRNYVRNTACPAVQAAAVRVGSSP
jgi:hypothetical protein